MKPNAAEIVNSTFLALAGFAMASPETVSAITAAVGPKWGIYLVAAKAAAGLVVNAYNRVKAANANDSQASAPPATTPESKP